MDKRKPEKSKKVELTIRGMHCASCEVLVEQKLKEVSGVQRVDVNHRSGKAEVFYSEEPSLSDLQNAIQSDGYSVDYASGNQSENPAAQKNTAKDYLQIGGIFLVVVSAYYIFTSLNLVQPIALSGHISYGAVFLIGLLAAVSTCGAVAGGLLLAAAKKFNEARPDLVGMQRFKPHLYFNVGRIVGYTGFGALIGGIGSTFTLSPQLNGYFILVISAIMLVLGIQMLNIVPWFQRFKPRVPKFISNKMHDLATKDGKGAPFALGALTFFLPCGFTQALQLYVLAVGDWQVGALTMFVFSLGTLPMLLSLGAAASFITSSLQRHFFRFAGVLIVFLAIVGVGNGLTLAGANVSVGSLFKSNNTTSALFTPLVSIVDGRQAINIEVSHERGIYPRAFTVKKNVPVDLTVDSEVTLFGCSAVWVIPQYNVSLPITAGVNTASFVPKKTGKIYIVCSSGINRIAEINVVDEVEQENTRN